MSNDDGVSDGQGDDERMDFSFFVGIFVETPHIYIGDVSFDGFWKSVSYVTLKMNLRTCFTVGIEHLMSSMKTLIGQR